MVRGDERGAARGHVLAAGDAVAAGEAEKHRKEDRAGESIVRPGPLADGLGVAINAAASYADRTRAGRSAQTWARAMPSETRSWASSAGRRGATARLESRASRSRWASRISSRLHSTP